MSNYDDEFQELNPYSLLENLKASKQVNLQGKKNAYNLLNLALEQGINAKIEEFRGDFSGSYEYEVYIEENHSNSTDKDHQSRKFEVELNPHYQLLAKKLLEHDDIPSFNEEDLLRDALFNLAYRTLGKDKINELFEETNDHIFNNKK